MDSRQRVLRAFQFHNPDRPPRDLWTLPAVEMFQNAEKESVIGEFPLDIETPKFTVGVSKCQQVPSLSRHDREFSIYKKGNQYIDEWGSVRYVAEDGVTGEVKKPVLGSRADLKHFSPPWEFLSTTDLSKVNEQCELSNKFMLSGVTARPFERMQFVRGTENLFKDLIREKDRVYRLRDLIHEYNLEHIKMWLKTNVDGIFMMDDWGAEKHLLISPALWRELLKPLYKEYCDLIHQAGKYVFFHSDGHIEEIFDDLLEVGIDALNSQLFVMDIEGLGRRYKGEICFWGEIDRRLLFFGSPRQVAEAVYRVRKALDDSSGGVIAQCEWGKNVPKENIEAVYDAWNTPLEDVLKNGSPAEIGVESSKVSGL